MGGIPVIEGIALLGMTIAAAISWRMYLRVRRQAQQLQLVERRFQELFERSTVALSQSNLDGEILVANQAMADLVGYRSPAELVQMRAADFWVDLAKRDEAFAILAAEGSLVGYEADIVGRIGRPIHVSISAQPLRDTNGTLVGWETSVIDLTDRHRADLALQEREVFFRALAENVSELIIRMDAMGRITYASPASRDLLGFEPEEMIGKTAADFVAAENLAEVHAVYARVFNGEPASTQQAVRQKSGERIWTEGMASPLNDPITGATTGIIWVVRDATRPLAELEKEEEEQEQKEDEERE